MNKKGAVAAIIAVVIAAGAIAAYSSNMFSPKTAQNNENDNTPSQQPSESGNQTTNIQTVHIDKNNKTSGNSTANNENTSISSNESSSSNTGQSAVSTMPASSGNSTTANNTIIANNTITINKPVYNNDTVIYQPVTIDINQYETKIKQTLKISENDKITVNKEGNIIVNNNDKKIRIPSPSTTGTYALTIRAARLPSDSWSGKFADDHIGMYVSVYDLTGKQIKTGFADESGLKITGLKNALYLVYPADCDNCAGTKNDILFQKWEDGSKDRPRMIPAGSDITASYSLKAPNSNQPSQQPHEDPVTITVKNLPAAAKVGDTINFTGSVKSNTKEITVKQGDTIQMWEADNVAEPTHQGDKPIREFTLDNDKKFLGSWLVQALDGTGCPSTEPNCETIQKDDMHKLELYFVYVNHDIISKASAAVPASTVTENLGNSSEGYYWSKVYKLGVEDISKELQVSAGIVKFAPNPAMIGDSVVITGYVTSPAFSPEGEAMVYGSTIHNSNGTIGTAAVRNVRAIPVQGGGIVYQGEFTIEFDVTALDNDATKDIFEFKATYVPSAYEPNAVVSNIKPPSVLTIITQDEIPQQPPIGNTSKPSVTLQMDKESYSTGESARLFGDVKPIPIQPKSGVIPQVLVIVYNSKAEPFTSESIEPDSQTGQYEFLFSLTADGNAESAVIPGTWSVNASYDNGAVNATTTFKVVDNTTIAGNVIEGTEGDDTLYGTAGDDEINGYAGNDLVYAADGDDKIDGGSGRNKLHGEEGNDYLVATNSGDETGTGPNYMYGDAGNDKIYAYGCDGCGTGFVIDGGDGADYIEANDAPHNITGGPGDDTIKASGDTSYTLYGDDGNDHFELNVDLGANMFGGPGSDTFKIIFGDSRQHGGSGDDILGGSGSTEMWGDNGADTFICSTNSYDTDTIHDFNAADGDVIQNKNMCDSINGVDQRTSIAQEISPCVAINAGEGCISNQTSSSAPTNASTSNIGNSTKSPSTANATDIVRANNQFALDLYSNLTSASQNQNLSAANDNIFFSPWSISTAFALVDEGARGKTASEIESVFGLPSDTISRRTSFESMLEHLTNVNDTSGNYTLDTADAIWIKNGYRLSDDYATAARQYYGSEVSNADFATEQGTKQINDWVESKTHDRIKELIPPGALNDLSRLVITNAVYFNGTWVTPFDENLTSQQDFQVGGNTTVQVPMMSLKKPSAFRYAETNELQILELPYEGKKLSMLVILPRNDGVRALHHLEENSLSLENLSKWENMLQNQTVVVNIPKFTLETTYSLNDILTNMGMPSAFDPDGANLSGMLAEPERLYIQAAFHKAFVDIGERGTVAAAATGIIAEATSVHEYPVFKADHPFIFLIQDNKTNNILFIGRVVNPA